MGTLSCLTSGHAILSQAVLQNQVTQAVDGLQLKTPQRVYWLAKDCAITDPLQTAAAGVWTEAQQQAWRPKVALLNIHECVLPHPGSDGSPKCLNHRSLILFKNNGTMACSKRLKMTTHHAALAGPAELLVYILTDLLKRPCLLWDPLLAVPCSDHRPCFSPWAGERSLEYLTRLHVFSFLGVLFTSYTIQIYSICNGWKTEKEEEMVNSLEVHLPLPFWNVQFQTWNSICVWFAQECSRSQKYYVIYFPIEIALGTCVKEISSLFLNYFLVLLSHIQFFYCFMYFVAVKQF